MEQIDKDKLKQSGAARVTRKGAKGSFQIVIPKDLAVHMKLEEGQILVFLKDSTHKDYAVIVNSGSAYYNLQKHFAFEHPLSVDEFKTIFENES